MRLDIDAILDLGLLQRDHREKFYNLARTHNFDIDLHWLEVDRDVRWQRVLGRNKDQGDTYSMDVDRGMFDFCEGLLENPTDDELQVTVLH
ncbi:MAG: AAA family ATPase [Emcibacter sp.]|nr:AAA family ATPase [Emcibacter sp.]